MKSYPTEQIRNIVFLGHSGCGKTSIAEAILYNSGAINRLGRVESGNTTSDFDEEEINRNMSLNLSVLACEWQDHKINILDTPGYMDFQGEMLSGLYAADAAVIVVDASSGVEVGTQQAWQMAESLNKPVAIFLNKMDRTNASYRQVISDLRDTFDATFVPMELPIRDNGEFTGVVYLLTRNARTGSGKADKPPESMADEIEEFRFELVEFAAEGDDDLMNKYFEEETLTQEEIAYGLRIGLRHRRIVPVFCGTAASNVALRGFMNEVIKMFPYPNKKPIAATNLLTQTEEMLGGDADGPIAAQLFKTINDQYGRVSYLRLWSGTITGDSRLYNARTESEERMGGLFAILGKEQLSIAEAQSGDIVGVVKLNEAYTGDTLSTRDHPLEIPFFTPPEPVYSLALMPETQADSAKLGPSLTRITEEDLTLKSRYERATRQTLLEGLGDTHLNLAVKRMKSRYGLSVKANIPKLPMLETISRIASSQYRHKKQSGGAGQFGQVHLRVEPLERGAGFEYKSEVFGGAISQSFLPSIEKGIKQVLEQGVIAGYPVVDVRAVVFDGKEHPVDSKDIAFQIAGREAFRLAVKSAGPVLLEPIMDMTITIPDDYVGDVSGNLSTRRGRLSGMEQIRGNTVITAQVPLAEVQRYATELRSITQGRGIYSMTLSHYEAVPSHIASDIIAQVQQEE